MIEESQGNFNLWRMLVVLARRKIFIVSFVLICTVVAVVVAQLVEVEQ